MEQVHKQIPKQHQEEEPPDTEPDVEPNQVSIEAGKFLIRLAHEYGNLA